MSKAKKGMQLNNLVGYYSWCFFDILRSDAKFLEIPATSWNEEASYVHGKNIVKALKVSNDSAERPGKLASDF